jgi:hypothetical protein
MDGSSMKEPTFPLRLWNTIFLKPSLCIICFIEKKTISIATRIRWAEVGTNQSPNVVYCTDYSFCVILSWRPEMVLFGTKAAWLFLNHYVSEIHFFHAIIHAASGFHGSFSPLFSRPFGEFGSLSFEQCAAGHSTSNCLAWSFTCYFFIVMYEVIHWYLHICTYLFIFKTS